MRKCILQKCTETICCEFDAMPAFYWLIWRIYLTVTVVITIWCCENFLCCWVICDCLVWYSCPRHRLIGILTYPFITLLFATADTQLKEADSRSMRSQRNMTRTCICCLSPLIGRQGNTWKRQLFWCTLDNDLFSSYFFGLDILKVYFMD